MDGRSQTN